MKVTLKSKSLSFKQEINLFDKLKYISAICHRHNIVSDDAVNDIEKIEINNSEIQFFQLTLNEQLELCSILIKSIKG